MDFVYIDMDLTGIAANRMPLFIRAHWINWWIHKIIAEKTYINPLGQRVLLPPKSCLFFGAPRFDELRKKVLDKINSVIFRYVNAQTYNELSADNVLRISIEDYFKTSEPELIEQIFSIVVNTLTNGQYLNANEYPEELDEAEKEIIKIINEGRKREQGEGAKLLDRFTEIVSGLAKVSTPQPPSAGEPTHAEALAFSDEAITALATGFYTPVKNVSAEAVSPEPSENQPAPPASAPDIWGAMLAEVPAEPADEPTPPSAGEPQPTEAAAKLLANVSNYASYIVNFVLSQAAKNFAKYQEQGGAIPQDEAFFKFDPRAVARANGVAIGGKTLALINEAVNELYNTPLQFVRFDGIRNGKKIHTIYKTRFVQSIEYEVETYANGVTTKQITAIKIDPFFIGGSGLPVIPTKKLFKGEYRGALGAGDIGTAATWILNQYSKGVAIPWQAVFDSWDFADTNKNRIKTKIINNITERGFFVQKLGAKGFKISDTQQSGGVSTKKDTKKKRKSDKQ